MFKQSHRFHKIWNGAVFIGVAVFAVGCPSTTTDIQWTYGGQGSESANAVVATSDGGYLVAGMNYVYTQASADYSYLLKTNADGVKQWAKSIGSAKSRAMAMESTPDGGYVIVGCIQQPLRAQDDAHLMKVDSTGALVWEKSFTSDGEKKAFAVKVTQDGGFILAGSTDNLDTSGSAVYLVRTDSAGNALWEKSLSSDDAVANAVVATADGGFVAAGSTGYTAKSYVAKVDASGNVLWEKSLVDDSKEYSVVTAAIELEGGDLVFAGNASTPLPASRAGGVYMFLARTDADGNLRWLKAPGATASYTVYGRGKAFALCQSADGGYAVAGESEPFDDPFHTIDSAMFLFKTDANGVPEWSRSYSRGYSTGASAAAIRATSDGGYVLAGSAYHINGGDFPFGPPDIALVKTDAAGNPQR